MISLRPFDPPRTGSPIPIAPLVDVIFITMVFFMTMSMFSQLESEISISVPKAEEAKESGRMPGEIIINVDKDGMASVNKKAFNKAELTDMLKRISTLYPNQPVIIRADKATHHEHVVRVLDACAAAGIWNIAFATIREE